MSRLVLGLDLGESSIGGALLKLTDDDELEQIVWANTRVFSGVIDPQKKITLNSQRRGHRGQRKTIDRRVRRRKRVENALVRIGLLPDDETERDRVLGRANAKLDPKWLNPYDLRKRAIEKRLEPFEIGRALQHILQRRGFRSNRKAKLADLLGPKSAFKGDAELQRWIADTEESLDSDDRPEPEDTRKLSKPENENKEATDDNGKEDPKKTLEAIGQLEKRWKASPFKDLPIGTYLATELEKGLKVRKRNRIRRDWLEEEFEAIWSKQSAYHPSLLTDKAKEELRTAFEQRPLKPFRHILPKRGWAGEDVENKKKLARLTRACSILGTSKPVARRGHWVSQRFRILETLRNLRLRIRDEERPLTMEEVIPLAERLQREAGFTWAQIRMETGVGGKGKFTIEGSKGSPTKLSGNTTEIALKKILGDKWDDRLDLTAEVERDQLEFMQDVETCPDPIALFKLLQRPKKNGNGLYPLTKRQAFDLICESFSSQTTNYSVAAMRRLVRAMLAGKVPHEARNAIKGEETARGKLDCLPPPPPLRNPRVHRALNEVRKVVNALIDCYGLPDLIRIELATELKENKKERVAHSKAIKDNELANKAAAEWYKANGRGEPSRKDLLKHRLWRQQNEFCPYCLKGIGCTELLEDSADIDHVVPITAGGMDSFSNKVLAHRECNADKGDRLPWDVWGHDKDAWDDRLRFIVKTGSKALRRNFERTELPEDFVERQLTETRYIAKEVVRYLDQLNVKGIAWGKRGDLKELPPGVRAEGDDLFLTVWPTNGGATGFLRRVWELNDILPKLETNKKVSEADKNRLDHRHHALDAIVVAMTNPKRYKAALVAYRGRKEGRELAKHLFYKPPKADIQDSIRKAQTSHALNKGIRGALHDASFYGRVELNDVGAYVRRVAIADLYKPDSKKPDRAKTAVNVRQVVYDRALREAILRRLDQGDWATAFLKGPNGELPVLLDDGGNKMHIETVRVRHRKGAGFRSDASMINIDVPGSKSRCARYVAPEGNHHAEIIRLPNGRISIRPVRMIDAAREMRAKRSPYGLAVREGETFVTSVAQDEIVVLSGEAYRIAAVSDIVNVRAVNDARSATDLQPKSFSLADFEGKRLADPLGNLTPYDGA